MADSGTLFDVISQRNLYDQHLWLSVATRPSYSIFTRVQRFLCAVSFFFLGMIANAMWYQDFKREDGDSAQSTGLTIGIIHVTYRSVCIKLSTPLITD